MAKLNTKRKKWLTLLFATIMIVSSLLATSASYFVDANIERDLGDKILCRFEAGRELANYRSTDYFYYLTSSKSAITKTESVSSNWFNKMLTLAGFDFTSTNEAILGRELESDSISDISTTEANRGAPKVSAFDRFGVAGLTWSSYQGEWKYNHVDICANQIEVSPTTYGTFYDGRLEPQSTYNEVGTSKDPRSIQFNKGLFGQVGTAAKDIIANSLFTVAKAVVSLTIVFVGLAFTDVTSFIGLSVDGTAGVTAAGIFTDIFNSIFSGFVVIFFVLTAVYLIYNGLIKRQLRLALNTLLKTIVIFIVAIIMASNPAYWVGVPNKVATYGQAIMLNSMAGLYDNDIESPDLCSTDVASMGEVGLDITLSDEELMLSEFEKVSKNMKSLIGCQLWEQLLFKPWIRGQFGEGSGGRIVEYQDLDENNLDNINKDWVGKASVPVGNGKTIDNWALFHLSTQTDVHSQVGYSNFPTYVNGVNADWWRVVDALSNYDETETWIEDDDPNSNVPPVRTMSQIQSEPTEYWQTWVGNNSGGRIGTAFIAIAFGIVGSIAPLVFALSSAVLGLGITLLMITSPIFLLFGTWGGRGDRIFSGWLSALTNTVIKKIVIGFLLVLSISLTMSVMNLVYEIGFIEAFLLMIIVAFILVKNKDKLLNMLASVDFGGAFDPRRKANQFMDKQKTRAKTVGKVGVATAAGAKAGIKTGQGAIRGAGLGARSQLRNALFQSPIGINVVRQLDIEKDDERSKSHQCITCFVDIGREGEEVAYRDDTGNYYCVDCAEEIGIETLPQIVVGVDEENKSMGRGEQRTKVATSNRSWLSHSKTRDMMESRVRDDKYYWNNSKVQSMIKDNLKRLREDMIVYNNVKLQLGKTAMPPALPEPLHEYVDIALINMAWTNGRTDVVKRTYAEAWKMWYEDNAVHVEGVTKEDIENFKSELEEYDPDVTDEETEKLMKDYKNSLTTEDRAKITDKDYYVYKNGKLILNKFIDIRKDKETQEQGEKHDAYKEQGETNEEEKE